MKKCKFKYDSHDFGHLLLFELVLGSCNHVIKASCKVDVKKNSPYPSFNGIFQRNRTNIKEIDTQLQKTLKIQSLCNNKEAGRRAEDITSTVLVSDWVCYPAIS